MEAPVKMPVILFTEFTPNPESLKFVVNRKIMAEGSAEFRTPEEAAVWSPLAVKLFELPYVKLVYFSANFVSLTKEFNYDWEDIKVEISTLIKSYLGDELPILNEGYADFRREEEAKADEAMFEGPDGEIARRVKDLIEEFVKPAVQSDGGNIEFKAYHDGVVHVIMQGSCSGCPSSTMTLKSGIEAMLQRMVPEVREVVQEMG
jgi:NFU1 iron-sulfur cluster scaffold homolog, mitochondrial